jgi:hypothetical protein
VPSAGERGHPAIDLADHRIAIDRDLVEGQPRRVRRVRQHDVLDL